MISKSHLISLPAVPGIEPRRIRALLRKYPELDGVATLSKSILIINSRNVILLKLVMQLCIVILTVKVTLCYNNE